MKRHHTKLISVLSVVIISPALAGSIIYVDEDAPGGGNGESWNTAYKYLQDALVDANALSPERVDIHVAQGIYKPDRSEANPEGMGDREASFHLYGNMSLKGGYSGLGSIDPNAQYPNLYTTILSGDLEANDACGVDPCSLFTESTRGENSYCIVTAEHCSNSAFLDGLVVAYGNAIGNRHELEQRGGGMCVLGDVMNPSCPSIRNCTFIENTASRGGAVFVLGGNPELVDCQFLSNAATEGGALQVSAVRGIDGQEDLPSFLLSDCVFADNNATRGGGAYLEGVGFVFDSCVFRNNSARTGGGLFLGFGNVTLSHCLLTGNASAGVGGAVYVNEGHLDVLSCTFSGNIAEQGKALASLTLWDESPAMPLMYIINTILWDGGDEVDVAGDSLAEVTYSDIQGGWPGTGNIDVDPLFVDPNRRDYHLKSQAGRWDLNSQTWVMDDVTSPCIDVGDPLALLGDELFPHGDRINMGAYGGTLEASLSYSNDLTPEPNLPEPPDDPNESGNTGGGGGGVR